LNDDSEVNHDPLAVVAEDRRRRGRVANHGRHLIALLRGQSVIESPPASDRNAEESPTDLAAKRKCDDLSAARGIILWALVGAGLWAVSFGLSGAFYDCRRRLPGCLAFPFSQVLSGVFAEAG
jgi:hypothetical protein